MKNEREFPVNKKEVEEELRLRDSLDLVLLLAIGPTLSSHLQVQKRALLISLILGIDSEAEPYKYGLYSETVTEKLHDAKNEYFIERQDNRYKLTPEGLCAYNILMDKLAAKKREDVSRFIKLIHKMDEKDLLVLSYHLLPESFKESEIKGDVLTAIKQYRERGFLKAKREKEKVVIEVKT